MIDVEDRTQADILKSINDAGYTIGHNSLTMLLSGNCFQAGMFEIIDVRFDNNKKKPEQVVIPDPINLLPEVILAPIEVAVKHEPEPIKTVTVASTRKPRKVPTKDVTHTPESILPGTKNAIMFEMLVRPQGATKEEIMKEFDWSPSCLASILYTVPKSKGYAVFAEKTEDDLHYHLYFIGGAGKVLPEQLVYRDRKGPVTKKATPIKTETPLPKVKVSHDELASIPANNIGAMAARMAQHFNR